MGPIVTVALASGLGCGHPCLFLLKNSWKNLRPEKTNKGVKSFVLNWGHAEFQGKERFSGEGTSSQKQPASLHPSPKHCSVLQVFYAFNPEGRKGKVVTN